jgi:hypothetical protein
VQLARCRRSDVAFGIGGCGSLANSLAASLLSHGLGALSESSVGLFIYEPKWAIVAMLAIMKTGNPYVPLGATLVRGCTHSRAHAGTRARARAPTFAAPRRSGQSYW